MVADAGHMANSQHFIQSSAHGRNVFLACHQRPIAKCKKFHRYLYIQKPNVGLIQDDHCPYKPNMERKSLLDMDVAAGGEAAAEVPWLPCASLTAVAGAEPVAGGAGVGAGMVMRGLAPLRAPMAARGIKAKLERTGARDVLLATADEDEAEADTDDDAADPASGSTATDPTADATAAATNCTGVCEMAGAGVPPSRSRRNAPVGLAAPAVIGGASLPVPPRAFAVLFEMRTLAP
jgi:hypothetical protein